MSIMLQSPLGTGVPNIRAGDYGFGDYYRNGLNVYKDVLGGFNSVMQAQEARNKAIQQRYDSLSSNVLGGLDNAEAGQMARIQDSYKSALGDISQSGVDRGLSNFTIQDSLKRGAADDMLKQQLDTSGQFAGQRAGYQTQLGLAGNAFAAQAGQQQDAMAQAGLGVQASYKSFLPDPLAYSQLAQQQDQFSQQLQQQKYEFQQNSQPQALSTAFAPGNPSAIQATPGSYRTTYFSPKTGGMFFGTGTM